LKKRVNSNRKSTAGYRLSHSITSQGGRMPRNGWPDTFGNAGRMTPECAAQAGFV
jgi:hypothetical protein